MIKHKRNRTNPSKRANLGDILSSSRRLGLSYRGSIERGKLSVNRARIPLYLIGVVNLSPKSWNSPLACRICRYLSHHTMHNTAGRGERNNVLRTSVLNILVMDWPFLAAFPYDMVEFGWHYSQAYSI